MYHDFLETKDLVHIILNDLKVTENPIIFIYSPNFLLIFFNYKEFLKKEKGKFKINLRHL